MKFKTINMSLLVIASHCCVSCNTLNGLGKDFQKIGSGMQSTAQGGAGKRLLTSQPISHLNRHLLTLHLAKKLAKS